MYGSLGRCIRCYHGLLALSPLQRGGATFPMGIPLFPEHTHIDVAQRITHLPHRSRRATAHALSLALETHPHPAAFSADGERGAPNGKHTRQHHSHTNGHIRVPQTHQRTEREREHTALPTLTCRKGTQLHGSTKGIERVHATHARVEHTLGRVVNDGHLVLGLASGLEAFSREPPCDSFGALAVRQTPETRGTAWEFLSYYPILPSRYLRDPSPSRVHRDTPILLERLCVVLSCWRRYQVFAACRAAQ